MDTKRDSPGDAPERLVVVDEGTVGSTLALGLVEGGAEVTLLTEDEEGTGATRRAGVEVDIVDTIEGVALDRADVRDADGAVVACRSDSRTLLVAQFLRRYGIERVMVLVDDPRRADAFSDANVEPLLLSRLLATEVLADGRAESADERERSEAEGGR